VPDRRKSGGEGEGGLRKEFRKNRNLLIETLFAKFSGLRPIFRRYFTLIFKKRINIVLHSMT